MKIQKGGNGGLTWISFIGTLFFIGILIVIGLAVKGKLGFENQHKNIKQ